MSPSDARVPVIVDAVRSPMGRYGGQLAAVRPDDLAAHVIRALAARQPAAVAEVEDVYFGAANQAGEDNRNVARMGALLAGLPVEVPGVTVNRLCGSGMEAVIQAAKAIACGEGEVYVAGGAESMTRAPFVLPKSDRPFPSAAEIFNTSLGWRMVNPRMNELYPVESLGATAENVAERHGIDRATQDEWAAQSHRRAARAQDEGWFDAEIVPLTVPGEGKRPSVTIASDEGVRRDTSLEALARLPAVFRSGGTVTAGNSSPLNDGAAALLLTSLARARALGLVPLARVAAWGHAGVHPGVMGIGPVPATRKALARAGWGADEIELVELNEAFAAQSVACVRELGLDPTRVNVAGGAIALGHPLGCSGARILTTLVRGLQRTGARRGLASMCIGVGQGIACLVERV